MSIDWTSIYGNTRKECIGSHGGWLVDTCISGGVEVNGAAFRNIVTITYWTEKSTVCLEQPIFYLSCTWTIVILVGCGNGNHCDKSYNNGQYAHCAKLKICEAILIWSLLLIVDSRLFYHSLTVMSMFHGINDFFGELLILLVKVFTEKE